VDIDHVLRKEVDMDCVTPSHPEKIPHGESVSINQLLDKGAAAYLDPDIIPNNPINLAQYPYAPRPTVMSELRERTDLNFLKAQISSEPKEMNNIIKDINKKSSSSTVLSSTEKGLPKTKVRKMKTAPSSYAHPQEPRLMEAPYGYGSMNSSWNELGNTKYGKPWIRTQIPPRGVVLTDGPR
jgi:DNA polymerase gamma 1